LGAHCVQVDFTEGRLALKLDPSGALLRAFVELNNAVLDRFSNEERRRIGVHTCPGGDHDSTHSADVDYGRLLPVLFELRAGAFYLELAGERDPDAVLAAVAASMRPDQRIFVGVIDPIDPVIETPEQVCERVLRAAKYIPIAQLGTTDDCGFSPFADDGSTARATAFAKIRSRVEGTQLAAEQLDL
jgi:5-methyltetrahydropteroyltriglutamate--homocysteine methyltransferase